MILKNLETNSYKKELLNDKHLERKRITSFVKLRRTAFQKTSQYKLIAAKASSFPGIG